MDIGCDKEKIMGWCGHGLYDGDGTRTLQLEMIQWAGIPLKTDADYEAVEKTMTLKKSKLTSQH